MSNRTRSLRRSFLLAAAGGAVVAAGVGLPLAVADAGTAKAVSCSALIEYSSASGLISTYVQDFKVAPGRPFSDDRSTVTRMEVFDASLNGPTNSVVISYFKDVSVFDAIDLRTSVNRKAGEVSGSHDLINSSGRHLTSYVVTCK